MIGEIGGKQESLVPLKPKKKRESVLRKMGID